MQQKADWVRKLYADGLSQHKIVQITGFTANGYLSPSFTPVNGHYGTSREGKLAPYRKTVLKMRRDGMKYEQIAEYIRKLGYTGSVAALRGFVTKEKRLQADLLGDENLQEKELIERKWMIRLLYRPLEKVKGITKEQYEAVLKEYPKVELVYHAIETFKLVFAAKETKYLLQWMEEVLALEIEELNSFIRGLEKDIDAVKNAVIFDCNNGLAEGSVNKLKVIKRIMYGRCGFELLRKKVILWDRWKHFN